VSAVWHLDELGSRTRFDVGGGIGKRGPIVGGVVQDQKIGTMHIALTDGARTDYRRAGYNYQGREVTKRRAVLESLTMLRTWLMAEGTGQ